MAPKKTTADSMVEDKPPDIPVPGKTPREPKPRKRVAVPRVKKSKARLKPVHIVKVQIRAPKGNETWEPDIQDKTVTDIEEKVTPNKTSIQPKTKSPKPPSFPRRLKKEVALKIANEVALAQLVKKSITPDATETKLVKKRIRKSKQKPFIPSMRDGSIATVVEDDKDELAVEPIVKATKTAMRRVRKRKPKLQTPTKSTAKAPKDAPSATFTEVGSDEPSVETVVSPKSVKKRIGKPAKASKELENKNLATSPVVKTKAVSITRPRGRPKTAKLLDTSGAAIVESMPISVKKRRGRSRVVRKNAALNETDDGKDTKPTNLVEEKPAESVKIAKDLPEALIIKTDDNKKDMSRTTSISDTFSWARDISSSSPGTILSSKSFECLNGKQLTVKVVDYKMLESLKLRKNLSQLSVSSEKTAEKSNVTAKTPLKRSAPKRIKILKEDSIQESEMMPATKKRKIVANEISTSQRIPELTSREVALVSTEKSTDIQTSPRKSTRLKNKLTNSPLEWTEEPRPRKNLKSLISSKTEVSNFRDNRKSGSRTSLSSDLTSETNKQAGKYSESSSSKMTSSMSIPMSAISEITRTEEAEEIEQCLRELGDILDKIDLESVGSERDLQILPKNIKFEIEFLSKWKNGRLTPFLNKAQSEKDTVKKYSSTKSMDSISSEPKENNPMENNTNSNAVEDHMISPNAVENHRNLFDSVDDQINSPKVVEDHVILPNIVEDCVNSPNDIEDKFEDNDSVVNIPNGVEHKFEYDKELDSFSDVVRKQSQEQRSQIDDDDDDLISLFADSIISGIESSKGHTGTAVYPFNEGNNSKETFTIPKLSKRSEEAPQIPNQAREKIIIKNKTKIICEKQNADSTSINKEEQNKTKNMMAPPIVPKMKPYETSPIRFAPSSPSRLFNGVCILFQTGRCHNYNCKYIHRKLSLSEIQNRLSHKSDDEIKIDYLYLKDKPYLKSLCLFLFAEACLDKKMDLLLEVAFDSLKQKESLKKKVLEMTLLYLKEKPMDVEKLPMNEIPNGIYLCDALMRALGETQNFSRFKELFAYLTDFMVRQNRKFPLNVAVMLLERIRILPYDENVLKALTQIIKNTESTIFENVLMPKFEEMLFHQNRILYEEVMKHKRNILKPTRMPLEPISSISEEFHEDNFSSDNFIQGNGNEIQSMPGQAIIENRRYTSPDTTHLDNLLNKPTTEIPMLVRTVDCNKRARTYIQPPIFGGLSQNINNHTTATAPSNDQFGGSPQNYNNHSTVVAPSNNQFGGSPQNYNNHSTTTAPSDNQFSSPPRNYNNHSTAAAPSDNPFKRPQYRRNNNYVWIRGNARMPRIQPNIVRPMYRPLLKPPFPVRGGHGYPRKPWRFH